MPTHAISFHVDGFDVDDLATVAQLRAEFDNVNAAHVGGLTTVNFLVDADSPAVALHQTVTRFRTAFPDVTVLRLDRDLVDVDDIAARTGHDPATILDLIAGGDGPSGFPTPVAVLAGNRRVWEWAPVVAWFQRQLGELDDEPTLIGSRAAAAFDAAYAA